MMGAAEICYFAPKLVMQSVPDAGESHHSEYSKMQSSLCLALSL